MQFISKYSLHFRFLATNNEVEYEAIITGLEAAKELEVWDLKVYSVSQLVIRLIKDDCMA